MRHIATSHEEAITIIGNLMYAARQGTSDERHKAASDVYAALTNTAADSDVWEAIAEHIDAPAARR